MYKYCSTSLACVRVDVRGVYVEVCVTCVGVCGECRTCGWVYGCVRVLEYVLGLCVCGCT